MKALRSTLNYERMEQNQKNEISSSLNSKEKQREIKIHRCVNIKTIRKFLQSRRLFFPSHLKMLKVH